jgi:hypothetical protein
MGPKSWEKFEDDFKLEYMDLDEFLTENESPPSEPTLCEETKQANNEILQPSYQVVRNDIPQQVKQAFDIPIDFRNKKMISYRLLLDLQLPQLGRRHQNGGKFPKLCWASNFLSKTFTFVSIHLPGGNLQGLP